jgi:hypothetical protein
LRAVQDHPSFSLSTSIQGTVGDRWGGGLDTELFELENWLATDKGLQHSEQTFHPRKNKLRKGTGILTCWQSRKSGVSEVAHSVVTINKRLLVME